jgi:hypothetical protein
MTHLGPDVLVARRADEREADQEHVRLRVRERAETVIVLLAGRIPEAERDRLAVDHHVRRVVVEHCPEQRYQSAKTNDANPAKTKRLAK